MKPANAGLAVAHLAACAIAAGSPHATAKVIEMLEALKKEVTLAGDAEAKTYDKFACFCKSTTDEKLSTIEDLDDEKKSLEAAIGDKAAHREELDLKMAAMMKTIQGAENTMKDLTSERNKE